MGRPEPVVGMVKNATGNQNRMLLNGHCGLYNNELRLAYPRCRLSHCIAVTTMVPVSPGSAAGKAGGGMFAGKGSAGSACGVGPPPWNR